MNNITIRPSFGASDTGVTGSGENPVSGSSSNGSTTAPLERQPQSDEYQGKRTASKKGGGVLGKVISFFTGAAIAVGATTVANTITSTDRDKAVITIPYYSEEHTVSDIAELYDIDENILYLYNGDITDKTEKISIPSPYDYLQEIIDVKRNQLFAMHTYETREAAEAEIEELMDKHALQQEVATTYTDGKFVYLAINDLSSIPQYEEDGINVEDFKDLFDIKDGAIQKYNSLDDCDWIVDEKGNGVMDFTNSYLQSGTVIKVKPNAIGNLSSSEDEEETGETYTYEETSEETIEE